MQQQSPGSFETKLRVFFYRLVWVWSSKYAEFVFCIIFKESSSFVLTLYYLITEAVSRPASPPPPPKKILSTCSKLLSSNAVSRGSALAVRFRNRPYQTCSSPSLMTDKIELLRLWGIQDPHRGSDSTLICTSHGISHLRGGLRIPSFTHALCLNTRVYDFLHLPVTFCLVSPSILISTFFSSMFTLCQNFHRSLKQYVKLWYFILALDTAWLDNQRRKIRSESEKWDEVLTALLPWTAYIFVLPDVLANATYAHLT
jgi:hypothetical protein